MVSAHTVEFCFSLIDKFTPVAHRLAQAAQSSMQSITKMGAAANAAEASINRMAAGQEKVARSFHNSARSVREAERANQLYFQSQARIEKQQIAMMERHQARQQLVASGQLPGARASSSRGGAMMDMMNAYFGFQIAAGVTRGVGHLLDPADAERMARTKMGYVGYSGDLMSEAVAKATALSRKYRNLSRADVLEQLYEGIAIHGDPHHAIENVDIQTRLASFLQGWEGGAHGHRSKDWNREVFAAIKSMEMYGVLNEHDPEKKRKAIEGYSGAMMGMKALYGDQAKLSAYLTLQQRAGASWYRLSENFRFNVAPALAQEMNASTVGQQLMTAYQSIAGGTKLRKNQMAMMKTYGLLEGERYSKAFRDKFANDPWLAADDLVQRGAKKYGLKAGSKELEAKLLEDIPFLAPNRNMAMLFANLIRNYENVRKHVKMMEATRKEMERIASGEYFAATTKGGAEASVGKQFKNFVAAIAGPALQPYIDRMNAMAGALNRVTGTVSTFFEKHPAAAKLFGSSAMNVSTALAGMAALAGAGFLWAGMRAGLGHLGFGGGAARVALGGAVGGLPGAAAATALMALPLLARTSPAHLATTGKAAAAASDRLIAGMSKAGRAAEFAAAGGWLGRLGRFGLWGGIAAGVGALAYSNRDSLASFGSGAMEFGRKAALYRLFSSETSDMLNSMFKQMKWDIPKLDFSSIQKAIETIAAALVKATERLRSHIAFQLGLKNFAEHYGPNGEHIPEWVRGTPDEAKIMARIRADNFNAWLGSSYTGDDFASSNSRRALGYGWSQMPNTMFGPQIISPQGTGAEIMEWGKLPGSGGAIPQAEAQREISVKTAVEGTVNGSVKVEITGTVNGPVNGNGTASVTGAVQGSSNASRGESSPLNLGAGN